MDYRQQIVQLEENLARELEGISHYLYLHPELGLEEHLAAGFLTEYLEEKGYTLIHDGEGGMLIYKKP